MMGSLVGGMRLACQVTEQTKGEDQDPIFNHARLRKQVRCSNEESHKVCCLLFGWIVYAPTLLLLFTCSSFASSFV